MAIPEDAAVAGPSEDLAYWKQKWAVDTESAYRSGYSQGYLAAYHDVFALVVKKGFRRAREIVNLLENHALNAVLVWRDAFDKSDPELEPPPKMDRPDWVLLRHRTFARDGRACVLCGSSHYLEVDHIKPVCQGGLPTEENLRVLCRTCNRSRARSQEVQA